MKDGQYLIGFTGSFNEDFVSGLSNLEWKHAGKLCYMLLAHLRTNLQAPSNK